MTRISLEHEGRIYTVAVDHDVPTCSQVVENLVRPLLRAAGYSEETIVGAIGDVADDAIIGPL